VKKLSGPPAAGLCFTPYCIQPLIGLLSALDDTSVGLELEENYTPLQIMTRHSDDVDE